MVKWDVRPREVATCIGGRWLVGVRQDTNKPQTCWIRHLIIEMPWGHDIVALSRMEKFTGRPGERVDDPEDIDSDLTEPYFWYLQVSEPYEHEKFAKGAKE